MKTYLVSSVCLALVTLVQAISVHRWTHGELTQKADSIAIIEAIATRKVDLKYPGEMLADNEMSAFQAWVTKFKILSAFKGGLDDSKMIEVVHFTYAENREQRIVYDFTGYDFPVFIIGPIKEEITISREDKIVATGSAISSRPAWLAFLSKRPDGMFDPATEPHVSAQSFHRLFDPRFH